MHHRIRQLPSIGGSQKGFVAITLIAGIVAVMTLTYTLGVRMLTDAIANRQLQAVGQYQAEMEAAMALSVEIQKQVSLELRNELPPLFHLRSGSVFPDDPSLDSALANVLQGVIATSEGVEFRTIQESLNLQLAPLYLPHLPFFPNSFIEGLPLLYAHSFMSFGWDHLQEDSGWAGYWIPWNVFEFQRIGSRHLTQLGSMGTIWVTHNGSAPWIPRDHFPLSSVAWQPPANQALVPLSSFNFIMYGLPESGGVAANIPSNFASWLGPNFFGDGGTALVPTPPRQGAPFNDSTAFNHLESAMFPNTMPMYYRQQISLAWSLFEYIFGDNQHHINHMRQARSFSPANNIYFNFDAMDWTQDFSLYEALGFTFNEDARRITLTVGDGDAANFMSILSIFIEGNGNFHIDVFEHINNHSPTSDATGYSMPLNIVTGEDTVLTSFIIYSARPLVFYVLGDSIWPNDAAFFGALLLGPDGHPSGSPHVWGTVAAYGLRNYPEFQPTIWFDSATARTLIGFIPAQWVSF